MPCLPPTTSHCPADTSVPVLDTTIGGVLRAAARRAPISPRWSLAIPSVRRWADVCLGAGAVAGKQEAGRGASAAAGVACGASGDGGQRVWRGQGS